jgi:cullin 3
MVPLDADQSRPALGPAVRWVQDVLDLQDKFDRILNGAFGGDKAVQTSINEVSESVDDAHE